MTDHSKQMTDSSGWARFDAGDSMQPHAGKKDYEQAFEGLQFPVSLSEVMKRARDVGGIDHEVHAVIGGLEKDRFETLGDLYSEIRGVYESMGAEPGSLPV